MSRVDELVAELCPGGVPHRALGDVADYSDTRVSASELDATSFVGVDNLLPNKGGKSDANYPPNTATVTAYGSGDILIGNIRPYLKKIWLANAAGGCSGDVLAVRLNRELRSQVEAAFLYYLLSSDSFFAFAMQHAKGAKMPRGDKAAILKFRIPIPPIEAQREIVRILDEFTQLEAELEAELEARRRQYEYYRGETFNYVEESSVQWMTLADICLKVSSGGTPRSGVNAYYGGKIPWLRTQEVDFRSIYSTGVHITEEGLRNSSAVWIPRHCVIVAMYGATAAKVAVNEISLTTNQACCNLEIDKTMAHHRYVFHWIASQYEILKGLGEGSQSNLNARKVRNFPIPIPSLGAQRKVVSRLDNFDALVNDLSIGLPAELNARRRQYEHYRNRLLTFDEAV